MSSGHDYKYVRENLNNIYNTGPQARYSLSVDTNGNRVLMKPVPSGSCEKYSGESAENFGAFSISAAVRSRGDCNCLYAPKNLPGVS